MASYESIFSIIGPVMVGPSSSHTAGAARLGRLTRAILGSTPVKARVLLHGSFAETGPGHGTDKALVAGLLGFETWDDRLKDSFEVARDQGMAFEIGHVKLGHRVHPCSAKLIVEDAAGEVLEVVGSSLGGGSVELCEINGFEVKLSGEYHTLVTIHHDRPGIIRDVSALLGAHDVNIAFMKVARRQRGDEAFMTVETDHVIPEGCLEAMRQIPGMISTRMLPLIS